MDFEKRLQNAVQRGLEKGVREAEEAKLTKLSQDEAKRMHSDYRLTISDHIENSLRKLINHFPGFELETLYGDRGWGAAIAKDEVVFSVGKRSNQYSRLEVAVRPLSGANVIDLVAKGTIRNKELFQRQIYRPLQQVSSEEFCQLADNWILEYAEMYAAATN